MTDWLWQAFGGETLPRQFFASIVQHSQTAEALPLTFIAVEGSSCSARLASGAAI
ncbi:hypothetical protein J4734_10545 [Klebsiella pneumoniae]|uniref:Uncharacterized protein n=1 Tax=Klebsiella pneumoniae TaxID=573 RepID=A0A939NUF9_KLEPN|nr:hypothetical protein [Klebsiella pneumoniae]